MRCGVAGVGLASLMAVAGAPPAAAQPRPTALSLDYCADQYVIALAQPGQVAGLSPAATTEYSYLAAKAADLPQVRPTGEEVLLAAPEVAVRLWGGGYNAVTYLRKFAIPVAQLDFGTSIAVARNNLRRIGRALGAADTADALIADMDARLARLAIPHNPAGARPRALYLTPSGMTSGADTFVHELLETAGVENLAARNGKRGWQSIDLEAIALDPPDVIVAAFFDLRASDINNWSIARHSFFRKIMADLPVVKIPSRIVACSAWFFVEAAERIHDRAIHGSRP